MLDPEGVGRRSLLEQGLEDIEGEGVGGIADGVDGDHPAEGERTTRHIERALPLDPHQAALVRSVGVGIIEGRRVAAQ